MNIIIMEKGCDYLKKVFSCILCIFLIIMLILLAFTCKKDKYLKGYDNLETGEMWQKI